MLVDTEGVVFFTLKLLLVREATELPIPDAFDVFPVPLVVDGAEVPWLPPACVSVTPTGRVPV